jgi:putative redox protein
VSRTGDSGEVVARWDGDWRATVTAGPFTFHVDEPEADGGTFTGPMPTEYFLASVASCYALAIAWAARRQGVDLPDLAVGAIGEYEGPRYSGIRLKITSGLPPAELEPLLKAASRVCYVSNTLAQPPTIDISVVEG